ncbi:hypothetical protein HDU85_001994 [Gaertneriomyces sp. JEL0708]|nr:hypothetical protein HDU85_001994 [Gaertneriomyces sp. JEL0708]
MSWKTIAAASAVALLAIGEAQAAPRPQPSECIPITSTTSCAPFNQGYYINTTELALVYGLSGRIPDADSWDRLVRNVTSGGVNQAHMWKNWAQCTGYEGQPIQYYRTYTCITDIFLYSRGCNNNLQPEKQPAKICEEACESYGAAVTEMITDNEVCPQKFGDFSQQVYDEVSDRRSYALTGAESCKSMISGWSAKDDGKGSCTWGVADDHTSCGFGGDPKTAELYCTAFPDELCCQHRGKSATAATPSTGNQPTAEGHGPLFPINSARPSGSSDAPGSPKSSSGSPDSKINKLIESANAETPGVQPVEGQEAGSKTGVIVGSVAAVGLVLAGGGFLAMKRYKALQSDAYDRKMSPGLMAPVMAQANGAVPPMPISQKRFRVIYEYTPQLMDELELTKGDVVEVWASYDDGWGKGLNLRTGSKGTFPMACIEPLESPAPLENQA